MGTVGGATNDILGRCPARSVMWGAQHISAFSRNHFGTKDNETGRPYETRFPQSKFRVHASYVRDWKMCKGQCTDQGQ